MKKNRVLASIVLTAGLGLSGVTTASASDAAPAQPDHGKGKRVCVIEYRPGHEAGGKPEVFRYEFKNGKYYVNGKEIPRDQVPAKKCPPQLPHLPGGGKGKVICVIQRQDGSHGTESHGTEPGQKVTEGADGRIYVNGKQISKEDARVICHRLPGDGKGGHVCVIIHNKDGQEPGKAGQTVSRGADGRVYVNGKQVPGDKLPQKCPPKLPQPPGEGKGEDTGGSTGKDTSVLGSTVRTVGGTVGRVLSALG
jgi:hypothetical protein